MVRLWLAERRPGGYKDVTQSTPCVEELSWRISARIPIPCLSEHVFSVDKCTKYWYTIDVKLSMDKVEYECRRSHLNLGEMLREAGVSRNAFYSLARKDYVVPLSLILIAERLHISVSGLLEEADTPAERMKSIIVESERVSKRHPGTDRDTIRHTLLLLSEKPVERLRRALRRGRFVDIR